MSPTLGAIADDYTGATDLATTLVARGYRTRVYFGVPENVSKSEIEGADAVVIGLKSRSIPVNEAVSQSIEALKRLRELGCERFYDKYCATFDSTPEGNIGPILDALMDELRLDRTVVVLPFPEAGRQVFNGHLFVDGVPLDETSMRDHPITPMTDSKVQRLLSPQTRRTVREIPHATVAQGPTAVGASLLDAGDGIVVIDAIDRDDLDTIARATAEDVLLSGGAGLAASFPPPRVTADTRAFPVAGGYGAILSGSASLETQNQIANAQSMLPSVKLDFSKLRSDFDVTVLEIVTRAENSWNAQPELPVLIYSVGSPEDIETGEHPSGLSTAQLSERALSRIARILVERGLRRLIVAGGETSGSVTQALGITSFEVDAPLSPGVAWAAATVQGGETFNLLLKSGSLGTPHIFTDAWSHLRE